MNTNAFIHTNITRNTSMETNDQYYHYQKVFKSLRLRPPTPEAYGKTADFETLCIPGSSQRRDPSAALLSSSDRSRLAALNVMLTPCPVP